MRLQIWAGALAGLFIALCIGAAFIAVFFTTLNDLWAKSEEIWEGSFSLIAWCVSHRSSYANCAILIMHSVLRLPA